MAVLPVLCLLSILNGAWGMGGGLNEATTPDPALPPPSSGENKITTPLPVLPQLFYFDRKECYDRLGCFTNKVLWAGTVRGPIRHSPWAPEKINTRFLLYTRDNLNKYQEFRAIEHYVISESNFKTYRKTRFIIHGFINTGETSWMVKMCQAMLEEEDVNCFCVDWGGGSRTLYRQAANNIRVVGAEVAYFINSLWEMFKYDPSNVHLIGHSLGAHAAGKAGQIRPGIGRITGLDPAGPYFQNTPPEFRLDPSDALFVDAIHTDSTPTILNLGTGGYGMSQTVGHLDFFPNGGKQMPGCKMNQLISHKNPDDIQHTVDEVAACNHLRSYRYYTESITRPDGFIGFPSSSYEAFVAGDGFPCPSDGCPWMGHYADQHRGNTSNTQILYLNTGDEKNYPRWRYKVSVRTAGSSSVQGNIAVSIKGSNGSISDYIIHKGDITPDTEYTAYIDAEDNFGSISEVKFVWHRKDSNIVHIKLGASSVTIQYGEDGAVSSFCGSETVPDTIPQVLRPCSSIE